MKILRLNAGHLLGAGALLAAALLLGALVTYGRRTIHEERSEYNHIIVQEDDEGFRYLLFDEDGGYQSVRKPGDTGHLELAYSKSMLVGLACVENPRKILIIGLGGASIPTFLHARYPETRIECVEIDPAVIRVTKKYFGFEESDTLQAYAADGRKFIEESREKYDLVFLDAFGDDFIPKHLTTREFLLAVKKILSPRGVVLGNVWSRVLNSLYDFMVVTYQDVFEQVYILPVPRRENVIVIAVPRREKLTRETLAYTASLVSVKKDFGFDLGDLVSSGFQDAKTADIEGRVLRDRTDAPDYDPGPPREERAEEPKKAEGAAAERR